MDVQRLERMTSDARNLARAGHLRAGISVGEAGEILWTITSSLYSWGRALWEGDRRIGLMGNYRRRLSARNSRRFWRAP
jgi:hypothetical protein